RQFLLSKIERGFQRSCRLISYAAIEMPEVARARILRRVASRGNYFCRLPCRSWIADARICCCKVGRRQRSGAHAWKHGTSSEVEIESSPTTVGEEVEVKFLVGRRPGEKVKPAIR